MSSDPSAQGLMLNSTRTHMLHVRTCRLLGHIPPCLPSRAERPPSGPEWIHEIKHGGFRIMARRDSFGGRFITRHGNGRASCSQRRR